MYIGRQNSVVRGEHQLGLTPPEGVGPEPLGHPPQGRWRVRLHGREVLRGDGSGGAVIAFWHGEQLPWFCMRTADRWSGQPERGWSATGG